MYVVRHAQVAVNPEVPPEAWRLSAEGLAAARELAGSAAWAEVGHVFSSPQSKCADTAAILAQRLRVPWSVAGDLREIRESMGFLGVEAFERRVGDYLEGAEDVAFEDYAAAQRRIVACLRALVGAHGPRSLAVVSHGRILTALFSALCGCRLGRAEWRSIGLPDLAVVDLEAGVVVDGFFAGLRVDASLLRG